MQIIHLVIIKVFLYKLIMEHSSESIKLDSKKGGVLIKSAGNITDAITIKASQGDLQTINIVNNYGISEKID